MTFLSDLGPRTVFTPREGSRGKGRDSHRREGTRMVQGLGDVLDVVQVVEEEVVPVGVGEPEMVDVEVGVHE